MVHPQRQPEVAELRNAVFRHPDVARLHVAVHDAAQVRVCQRRRDVGCDGDRLPQRQRTAAVLEQQPQIATLYVFAHDVRPPAVVPDVVHDDNVRVVQPPHRLRLALQLHEIGGFENLGFDQGECAVAVERIVQHQVDDLLAAFAEHRAHRVPPVAEATRGTAGQCCREHVTWFCWHSAPAPAGGQSGHDDTPKRRFNRDHRVQAALCGAPSP